jgi:hypothetical protein
MEFKKRLLHLFNWKLLYSYHRTDQPFGTEYIFLFHTLALHNENIC